MARTMLSNLNSLNKLKKQLGQAFTGIDDLPTDIDWVNEVMGFVKGKCKDCKEAEPEPKKKDDNKETDKKDKKPSFMERRKAKKQKA